MSADRFRADVQEVRDELRKAEYALDIRRYDLAIDLLHQMLKEHPDNSAVFYTLARAYLGKKKPREASQAVLEALHLDPLSSKCHTLYGIILTNENRFREAALAYQHSLALQPDVANTHYRYSALLIDKLNNISQAKEHALKALALDPATSAYHVVMAKVLAMEGNFAGADDEFRLALSLDPEQALVRRVYGWYLLYKRNQPEQAFEHLQRAVQLDPEDEPTRKIFLVALKAKQKRYRLIWSLNFLLFFRWGKVGWYLFLLALLILIVLFGWLSSYLGTNPGYQVLQNIFDTMLFVSLAYTFCVNIMFRRIIKHGRTGK